jgi:hypothetical protein
MVLILLDSNRSGIKPGALKFRRGHTALGGKAPAVVIDRMIGLADLEHDRGPERQRPGRCGSMIGTRGALVETPG